MPTMIERRIAGLEAKLAEISPPPSRYDEFIMQNPWIEWATCDELVELELVYRTAEETEWTPSAEARAMAIAYAGEARRLAGEPPASTLASLQQTCARQAPIGAGMSLTRLRQALGRLASGLSGRNWVVARLQLEHGVLGVSPSGDFGQCRFRSDGRSCASRLW